MSTTVTPSLFDSCMHRVVAGEPLAAGEIRELAGTPDILLLGMLADALRRRRHGTRTTYLRVASCPFDRSFSDAVPPAAREIRITGEPETLSLAVSAVTSAKAVAGARTVSAFSWAHLQRLAGGEGIGRVLQQMRGAGLDAVAHLPLDGDGIEEAVERLKDAGFTRLRLAIDKAPAASRVDLLIAAERLQDRFACIQAINPLPMTIGAFRPTTGYEDVKMVAIARLAAPGIPTVQVDWPRYGPKLAQVALTFGADDIDGVSASDEAPEGRRRAPIEEIRRNVEAAGLDPAERDGSFSVIA